MIALVIVIRSAPPPQESTDILLETCPVRGDRPGDHRAKILSTVPEVRAVHDLHIWSITSRDARPVGHIVVAPRKIVVATDEGALREGSRAHRRKFDITHSALQIETETFRRSAESLVGRIDRDPVEWTVRKDGRIMTHSGRCP